MIPAFWAILAILVLWAAIVVLRRRREGMVRERWQPAPDRSRGAARGAVADDIDLAALEEAEKEVQDLETDAKGRPLDDVVGDDWGPGTPKPPYT